MTFLRVQKKIQGGRFQFNSRKHFPKDRVAQQWHCWEVVGISKQKRTPEGAENRRELTFQPHSGICSERLPSSMGSGLIVLSVWGGLERGVWGVCVGGAPMMALFS